MQLVALCLHIYVRFYMFTNFTGITISRPDVAGGLWITHYVHYIYTHYITNVAVFKAKHKTYIFYEQVLNPLSPYIYIYISTQLRQHPPLNHRNGKRIQCGFVFRSVCAEKERESKSSREIPFQARLKQRPDCVCALPVKDMDRRSAFLPFHSGTCPWLIVYRLFKSAALKATFLTRLFHSLRIMQRTSKSHTEAKHFLLLLFFLHN